MAVAFVSRSMADRTEMPDYGEMQAALQELQSDASLEGAPCPHPRCPGSLVREDGSWSCSEHEP